MLSWLFAAFIVHVLMLDVVSSGACQQFSNQIIRAARPGSTAVTARANCTSTCILHGEYSGAWLPACLVGLQKKLHVRNSTAQTPVICIIGQDGHERNELHVCNSIAQTPPLICIDGHEHKTAIVNSSCICHVFMKEMVRAHTVMCMCACDDTVRV